MGDAREGWVVVGASKPRRERKRAEGMCSLPRSTSEKAPTMLKVSGDDCSNVGGVEKGRREGDKEW